MAAINNFMQQTGFYMFGQEGNWKCLIMIAVSFVLLYPVSYTHLRAHET